MAITARRTDPALWERVKRSITRGAKGGPPGAWSARKAQLAVHEYKRRGGGYAGAKPDGNALDRWTREDWGTRSGRDSAETGERYLPRAVREGLSDAEYRRTSAKKRADTAEGKRVSAQPADVARKAAALRKRRQADGSPTRAALLAEARRRGLAGRSRMTRAELAHALGR